MNAELASRVGATHAVGRTLYLQIKDMTVYILRYIPCKKQEDCDGYEWVCLGKRAPIDECYRISNL